MNSQEPTDRAASCAGKNHLSHLQGRRRLPCTYRLWDSIKHTMFAKLFQGSKPHLPFGLPPIPALLGLHPRRLKPHCRLPWPRACCRPASRHQCPEASGTHLDSVAFETNHDALPGAPAGTGYMHSHAFQPQRLFGFQQLLSKFFSPFLSK